jgi:hypothetical protein
MAVNSSESPRLPGSEPPTLSRSLIVTLRVLLLLAATGAVLAGLAIAIHHQPSADSGARYTCPMHPEVQTKEQGECPICHMALEPTGGEATGKTGSHGAMQGMADLVAVENVHRHKIVDFVRMRSLILNIREMRGPAWVEEDGTISALLYKDQVAALSANETGTFIPTRTPTATIAVKRTVNPEAPWPESPWDRSTSRIRFHLDGARSGGNEIMPGQVGWLVLSPKAREVLGVPASAVLQSPEGPYVLAWVDGLKFEKRQIEIGETFLKQGFAVVLSGLTARDRVVSKATFFVDANRRLGDRGGEEGWVIE